MSTNYLPSIAVGLPETELASIYEEHLQKFIADSAAKDNILGFLISTGGAFSYTELDLDALQHAIDIYKNEFLELTGKQAKIYLTLDSF